MMTPTNPTAVLKRWSTSPRLVLPAIIIVVNLLLFSLTDPVQAPPVVVFCGFLVAATDIWLIVRLLVRLLITIVPALRGQRRRLVVLLTAFSVTCLGLASIGQLTWRDLLVVVIVAVVGYFYSVYFRFSTP